MRWLWVNPTFGKGTVQQYRSLNRIYDHVTLRWRQRWVSWQYTIEKFIRVNGGSTQRKVQRQTLSCRWC